MCSSDWLSRAQVLDIVCFCIHQDVIVILHVRSCRAFQPGCFLEVTTYTDPAGARRVSTLKGPNRVCCTCFAFTQHDAVTCLAPVSAAFECRRRRGGVPPRRSQTESDKHRSFRKALKASLSQHVQHTRAGISLSAVAASSTCVLSRIASIRRVEERPVQSPCSSGMLISLLHLQRVWQPTHLGEQSYAATPPQSGALSTASTQLHPRYVASRHGDWSCRLCGSRRPRCRCGVHDSACHAMQGSHL